MTGEQVQLFDESAFPAGRELLLPQEEQLHRFTGEQVKQNRERYAAIVRALAEGIGIRRICKAFAVSQHTVEGIRERESALVATEKADILKTARRLVRMTGEAMTEHLEDGKITPGQIPVSYGIAVDKMIALEASTSTLTLTVKHEVNQEQVRQLFEQLANPAPVLANLASPGRVLDVESTISAPIDNHSVAKQAKPLQIEGKTDASVTCVATPDHWTGTTQPGSALSGAGQHEAAGQDTRLDPRRDCPGAGASTG